MAPSRAPRNQDPTNCAPTVAGLGWKRGQQRSWKGNVTEVVEPRAPVMSVSSELQEPMYLAHRSPEPGWPESFLAPPSHLSVISFLFHM